MVSLLDVTPWAPRNSPGRILKWLAIPFSRGSSQPRIEPRSPTLQADFLPSEPPAKPTPHFERWMGTLLDG